MSHLPLSEVQKYLRLQKSLLNGADQRNLALSSLGGQSLFGPLSKLYFMPRKVRRGRRGLKPTQKIQRHQQWLEAQFPHPATTASHPADKDNLIKTPLGTDIKTPVRRDARTPFRRVARTPFRRNTTTTTVLPKPPLIKPPAMLVGADAFPIKCDLEPTVEPSEDGTYELDPLLSRAVESELQQIMIKVWQELPDEPPTDAETVVADKFRTEAGDELRNILGLNITKRLVNIYNPLIIKLQLEKKPLDTVFHNFLRWMKCIALKRTSSRYIYLAQVKTIQDFDRVCKKKIVNIRGLNARVSPLYTFIECPPKLKTIYKETIPIVKESTNVGEKKAITKKQEIVQASKKVEGRAENIKKITATTKIPEEATMKIETKPAVKKAGISTDSVSKKTVNKPAQPKSETAAKPETKKTVSPTVNKPKKTAPATIANAAKKTENSSVSEVKKTAAKPTPAKTTTVKTTQSINAQKIKPGEKTPAKQVSNINELATKVVAKQPVKTKMTPNKEHAKKESKKGDFDELNDADILALMSNAIVLDECSGSDNE